MRSLKIAFTLLLFAFFASAFAQTKPYQFTRIGVNEGLSHYQVNDILKDSKGFMWFATLSGLNRFDGYFMKVFRNVQGDTTSLLNDDITGLFEGPEGKLWTYRWSGNNVYDPKTERFTRNTNAILKKLGIPSGVIRSIKKDSQGNYWFIHNTEGLFFYNAQTQQTTHLYAITGEPRSVSSNTVSSITEDKEGNMWMIHRNGTIEKLETKTMRVTYRNNELSAKFNNAIYDYGLMVDADGDAWILIDNTNQGCYYLKPADNTLLQISNTSLPVKLNSGIIKRIVQADNGLIWIATDHGGLNVIDKKDNFSVQYVVHDEHNSKSLSQNSLNALYKDNEGIIWAGTYKKGVSYYHENIFRFQLFSHHLTKPESLPFNDINSFAEDRHGNLWIGTNGGGLIYFDRKKNTYEQYLHNPKDPNSLSNNVIVSLCMDHKKRLWIGTYYGGLNCFDGQKFTRYKHDPTNPNSLSDDNVWEIMEDSRHQLWVGTMKGGLDLFNPETKMFVNYFRGTDEKSIRANYVPALAEDRNGNIWIGTDNGINVYDTTSRIFTHYYHDENNASSISNNSILSILEDSRGWLWVGTHGGLNLFNKEKKSFKTFKEEDGLPHNAILSLLEDNQRNIWMSTPNGMSKLTISKSGGDKAFVFRNYDEADGLQGKAFNESAALKTSNGDLVVGGANGFNIFDPEAIGVNTYKPNVVFTDFQVFNKSVKTGTAKDGEVLLKESVSDINEITLKHSDNVFSLEFAALNYLHPEKNTYKYILEGFNTGWLTTDAAQRKVTFTNLDPGKYTFKVKASNNDGLWSDTPTTLRITVLPPFWKSEIAFVLYAFFIIGVLFLARWLTLANARMNFRIQQERKEAEQMHELDMMKIRFFTNVSHEFRTPLTLILTPMEKLLKNVNNDDNKSQFQLIHRNAKRLLNLVNQLLDFRKMEVQELKYTPSEGDMVGFVKEIVHSFSDLSEKKNIQFSFHSSIHEVEALFDQDKVEKILFNLLSNAFKFTPERGTVSVHFDVEERIDSKWVKIQVKDSGIGIQADKLEKIFERFFQNDLPKSVVNQGSGIGLSITKEFVKIHGGTISVESELEKGSCFTVCLPLKEIASLAAAAPAPITISPAAIPLTMESAIAEKKPVLLLMEDNEDFRFYLKDNLKLQYTILEARDGKEGLEKAQASIPDLIVSDIMMPEMNGIELCKKIKTDPRTSHIPVILLTARTTEEQKLEGFESGANDYITKPFNFEILLSRIKNLITQRESFQKRFQQQLEVKVSDIHITSLDEKLITNAIKIVEDNMANPDFSVEEFSRELGMSRVHLYKKLLSLTGKPPIEFIRSIRLQRAAQLLEKSQLTVSEVAYKVGFNNPKYFTKYFKGEYNTLPSLYASEKKMITSV